MSRQIKADQNMSGIGRLPLGYINDDELWLEELE